MLARSRACFRAYVRAGARVCASACVLARSRACFRAYVRAGERVCASTCVLFSCLRVLVYVRVYVYVCVHSCVISTYILHSAFMPILFECVRLFL